MSSSVRILLLVVLLSACRSTQKLYDKGQYDKAYYSAVSDLKKNPSNESALHLLPDSYKEASARYEQDIEIAKGSRDRKIDNLGIIYDSYQSLQKLYDTFINSAIQSNSFSPRNYSSELETAAQHAASAQYNRGLALLNHNDRISARKAYDCLSKADSYVPGYKDVIIKKQQAYDAAITNIVVNKTEQRFGYYSINGSFFESDILWNLNSIGSGGFYKFYSINDGQSRDIRVDEYIDLNMYDIWFSNLATNQYSYAVSKQIQARSDKMANSSGTITVSATVTVTRRVINSKAVLDYRITDAASGRIITSDRIPAQYTWESLTGKYTGDPRALSAKDNAIINGSYNSRPGYDELYRELTRQILTQFNFRMRDIYR